MKLITIDASPKQLSKLRNGHSVRIKKGTGFNLLIHPETYHLVSRAFGKSKGVEIKLSPEEIEMNKGFSPEQHMELKETQPGIAGQGIFGKKFDKFLKKMGIKDAAYKIGDAIKPYAKAGITGALTTGATMLGAVQPELIPFLPAGVAGLSTLASDYLDSPSKYQGKSGIRTKPARSFKSQIEHSSMDDRLNRALGTNYGYMGRAGIESALANSAGSRFNRDSYASRFGQPPAQYGQGLYAGGGMFAGGGMHVKTMDRSIMGRGNMSGHYMPQALMSQPLGANFQFQHFLPPAYQKY